MKLGKQGDNRGRLRSWHAFTLIEILLSMAVLTIVVASIYSTWLTIMRATESGEKATAQAQRSRMAVQTVEAAIAGTTMFAENITYYSFDVDTTGDYALLSFAARLPDSFPGSGMFPGQPLRRVTFSVEAGDNGNNLIMRQQPLLEVLDSGVEPYPITLARNVDRFETEFWDTNALDWAYDWAYTNQLPPLVRLTIAFGNEKNQVVAAEDVVSKVISIPAEAVTRDYQLASGGAGAGGRGNNGQPQVTLGPDGQPILLPPGGRGRGDGNRGGPNGGFGPGGGGGRGDGVRGPGQGGRGGGFPGQFPGQGGPRQGGGGGQFPGQGGFPNQGGVPGQGGFGGGGRGR